MDMNNIYLLRDNIMKIEVINRKQAENTVFENDTLIVSISDKLQEFPNIKHDKVLFLNFDDEEQPHANAMTNNVAKLIIDFVNKYKDGINKIIVHCGAGISRSAGVASALGKWLNNDDSFVFNNPKFSPNMTCYRLVLNEIFGEVNENELEKLFSHNLEIWSKENLE